MNERSVGIRRNEIVKMYERKGHSSENDGRNLMLFVISSFKEVLRGSLLLLWGEKYDIMSMC